jgi:hypothetical protein
MAFGTEERAALATRVRYELGYSALTTAGEPYFAIAYSPEKALDSLYSGATTTSATTVDSTELTAPKTITLASGTGFVSGLRVHVGAGTTREIVVAQNVSGASLTATFGLAHSGTYPVEVDSGEAMLRTLLAYLDRVNESIHSARDAAGIQEIVGDLKFFESAVVQEAVSERKRWRRELGSLLKLPVMNENGMVTRLEAY